MRLPLDSLFTRSFSQPPKNLVAETAEVAIQVICSSVAAAEASWSSCMQGRCCAFVIAKAWLFL